MAVLHPRFGGRQRSRGGSGATGCSPTPRPTCRSRSCCSSPSGSLDRNVVRTKLGRAFQMLREDEDAAQSFGIDVTRYKLLAFVLAGAIAGLAGAMYGSAIGLVNSDAFTLDLSLAHRAVRDHRRHRVAVGSRSPWRSCWPSPRSCRRRSGAGT